MFESMLDHPNIHIELGVYFSEIRNRDNFAHLAFTGPIDAYFDCRFGALPYRSLRFEHEHFSNLAQFQKTGTVNYPNDHARSEEHTSELQSLVRISYAVFCLKKKKNTNTNHNLQ